MFIFWFFIIKEEIKAFFFKFCILQKPISKTFFFIVNEFDKAVSGCCSISDRRPKTIENETIVEIQVEFDFIVILFSLNYPIIQWFNYFQANPSIR